MDKLNSIISDNLKELRENRKLSLDQVAKLTGVSKSMLGQIERGEVNPTISTVWKISNGLKISFTQLMSRPETDIEKVMKEEIEPVVEGSGKIRNFPIFPFDSMRRFEMFQLEIDEDGRHTSEAHPMGTQEFITVFEGEVTIEINQEVFSVEAGDSLRFKADKAHTYSNTGSGTCKISMVIYYPE